MPRVKRGVTARARHKKVLAQAKGFRGRRGNVFRIAKEAVMKAGQYAYRDRRTKKTCVSPALDRSYQCGGPRAWHDLQPVCQWPEESGHRDRPQDVGRLGRARQSSLWAHCRASQSQVSGLMSLTRLRLISRCAGFFYRHGPMGSI